MSHLLDVIEDLTAKGAHFRSLRDPIDTSTPQGMFSLQVLGAVAQLERALISERTKAGIAAAKAKGRLPGNPGIRERRPEMLSKMKLAQQAAYGARLQATASQWLPTVKRMRPDHTWDDIARVLKPGGELIVVGTGEQHLLPLREALYEEVRQSGFDAGKFLDARFTQIDNQDIHLEWVPDDEQELQNLLAMTPHHWRAKPEAKAEANPPN